MPALTIYLSRLTGVVMLVIGVAMLVDKAVFLAGLQELGQDETALFVLGLCRVVIGAGIVLVHNVWRKGLCPLVVTLTGWAVLVRGVMNLFLPPDVMGALLVAAKAVDFYYVYTAIPILVGAYLTLRGFSVSAPPLGFAAAAGSPEPAKSAPIPQSRPKRRR
jgi:predicted membrane protein